MTAGLCRIWLRLPESSSLKQKRRVVKSLTSRIHNKFNVAVSEVGDHDSWQLASLGLACVTTSQSHAHQVLSKVVSFIERERRDTEILDYKMETLATL